MTEWCRPTGARCGSLGAARLDVAGRKLGHVQKYLTYKKTHPPRTLPQAPKTLPQAYAQGPRGVLGGWAFSHGRGTAVPL